MKRCLMVLKQVCLNEGPRVQYGPALGGPGFNHRKTWKNIKNSSVSEQRGLDALNSVCSIA